MAKAVVQKSSEMTEQQLEMIDNELERLHRIRSNNPVEGKWVRDRIEVFQNLLIETTTKPTKG
jgi:hypothetical protein